MFQRDLARRLGAACLVPALLLSACAMGGDPPANPTSGATTMQQRFIVRYVADSAPGRESSLVADRVEATAQRAGITGKGGAASDVTWVRRLGVGADVVAFRPELDTAQAQRLLEALNADPEVEYAEPDGVMTIGPRPGTLRGPAVD